MSNFNETLARMKDLYTYGKDLNENKKINTHTLEYHRIGADGKSYGIIKECNKYYIKTAPKDKEMVAESYDYIGGFCNKKNYEYNSYANALKNFELKLSSINEAFDGNVNTSTLDPFKKEEFLVEATDKMKNEIARQRQIMYNASMIMNESIEKIGANEKDNVVKYDGENPETPKKKGKSTNYGTEAKVIDQDKVKGTSGDHKPNIIYPFDQKVNEGTCCSNCGKENCNCKNCNEESGDIGDSPLMPNTENWGTKGIGKGKNPGQIGWDMNGQECVNEETDEWDDGLPSSSGIGTPNNRHNNTPFTMNENDEDIDNDDLSTDTDFDNGINDDFSDDNEFNLEISNDTENNDDFDEEDLDNGDEFDDEEEFDKGDEFNDEEDLEKGDEFNDEEEFDNGDEFDDEEEFDNGDEFDDEEEFDNGDEFDDEEEFDNGDNEGEYSFEMSSDDENNYDSELDECGNLDMLNEAKKRKMNKIVKSVTNSLLKENELHVFGKHPGYRKKPMELPSTGDDQNQWGRDWNDESVHSEEPFGKQIGNGDPFTQLVNAVTKDVMYQLKKGIPIEGANKKKVD